MSELYVESLYSYPVKSCAPLELDSFEVTEQGFALDREWVVTRPNGVFLSQRQIPELALVKPHVDDGELILSAPSNGSVRIPLEHDPAKVARAEPITIFDKEGTAYNEIDEASDFFSDYLGKQVLLKRAVVPRPVNPKYQKDGASVSSKHADGFPFMMTSAASLDLLSAEAGSVIPMSRFRPNIVINGESLEPYIEDYWREVQIGKMRAFVVKACDRCPMPDIDQSTGKRDPERIVNRVLHETRSGTLAESEKVKVFFGQNLLHIVESDLRIAVGDVVTPKDGSWRRNFIET